MPEGGKSRGPQCAICGAAIEPPVRAYNTSEEPVHAECLGDAITEVANVLGF